MGDTSITDLVGAGPVKFGIYAENSVPDARRDWSYSTKQAEFTDKIDSVKVAITKPENVTVKRGATVIDGTSKVAYLGDALTLEKTVAGDDGVVVFTADGGAFADNKYNGSDLCSATIARLPILNGTNAVNITEKKAYKTTGTVTVADASFYKNDPTVPLTATVVKSDFGSVNADASGNYAIWLPDGSNKITISHPRFIDTKTETVAVSGAATSVAEQFEFLNGNVTVKTAGPEDTWTYDQDTKEFTLPQCTADHKAERASAFLNVPSTERIMAQFEYEGHIKHSYDMWAGFGFQFFNTEGKNFRIVLRESCPNNNADSLAGEYDLDFGLVYNRADNSWTGAEAVGSVDGVSYSKGKMTVVLTRQALTVYYNDVLKYTAAGDRLIDLQGIKFVTNDMTVNGISVCSINLDGVIKIKNFGWTTDATRINTYVSQHAAA